MKRSSISVALLSLALSSGAAPAPAPPVTPAPRPVVPQVQTPTPPTTTPPGPTVPPGQTIPPGSTVPPGQTFPPGQTIPPNTTPAPVQPILPHQNAPVAPNTPGGLVPPAALAEPLGGTGYVGGTAGTATSPAYVAGGGRGSYVRLVTLPEVQQDLALTPAQLEAIQGISQRVTAYETQMFWEIQNPPPTHTTTVLRSQWTRSRYDAANRMLFAARNDLVRNLAPAQLHRLEQIGLQDYGAEALFHPEIARQLALTPAQRQSLARLRLNAQATAIPNPPVAGVTPSTSVSPVPRTEIPTPGQPRTVLPGGATEGTAGGAVVMTPVAPEPDRQAMMNVLTTQQRSKFVELQGRPLQINARPANPSTATLPR